MGLRVLMMAVPIAGLVFSICYFRSRYKLTDEENARIAQALKERRSETEATK